MLHSEDCKRSISMNNVKSNTEGMKVQTLSEVREKDTKYIRSQLMHDGVKELYKILIIDLHNKRLDELGKALAMGKLVQDMLLRYMTPAEIKRELANRLVVAHYKDISLATDMDLSAYDEADAAISAAANE